ncbi:MAG: Aspartate kinase [Alphaproteobacteria bacterium MarineAlpha9_Bin4]|nr:aspartate kinase [Pelagibacterales bacterium]PPR26633.1 MAG: Aspartate kinase [Alphaproteobacteria bacterium MarineAlpha9_Bin4]|tara:strand:- start:589 stop:1818 length:1230 start_codon:yes stop_codon:yes gene_type:complete
MQIIVKKFGGTSLADISRINRAVSYVKKSLASGYKVVVVVSAMGKETDRLLSLEDKLEEYKNSDDIASLLSSGEQISSSFFSIILNNNNIKGKSFQGWQLPIYTSKSFINSHITNINTKKIISCLKKNQVPVVSGFQGINMDNRITTLGRGGSDTTAVALAAKLKAERCDIYTDVDGVYTGDPRIILNAKKMKTINFEEMLELSSLGAKVLHTRSVQLALQYGVKMQVLSSFTGKKGTMLVKETKNLENQIIRGIAHSSNEALITLVEVKNKPGISAVIFNALASEDINVDMIVQSASLKDEKVTYGYTVSKNDANKTRAIMEKIKKKLSYKEVIINKNICKVSVVGLGMKTNAGIANTMFSQLAKHNINVHVISTSEIKISILIDDKYKELALRSLHQGFKLNKIKTN